MQQPEIAGIAGVPPMPYQVTAGKLRVNLVAERDCAALSAGRVVSNLYMVPVRRDMGYVRMVELLAIVGKLVTGHP